jgi:hypothetical protein
MRFAAERFSALQQLETDPALARKDQTPFENVPVDFGRT